MSNFIHVNQDKYIGVKNMLPCFYSRRRVGKNEGSAWWRQVPREREHGTGPVSVPNGRRQSGRSWCSQHTGSIELWQKTGVYFSSHVWMSSGCHKDAVSSRCHWRHAALGKMFMFFSFTLFPSLIIGFWLVWERCEVNSSHVRVI